jgi:hypothetical protein
MINGYPGFDQSRGDGHGRGFNRTR